MPPQTKPMEARLAGAIKAFKAFTGQTGKVDKANTKAQQVAAKAASKAATAELKFRKQITAELTKQVRLTDRIAKANKTGGQRGGGRGDKGSFTGGISSRLPSAKAVPGMVAAAAVGAVLGIITSQVRASIDSYAQTVKSQRNIAGVMSRDRLDSLVSEAEKRGFDPQEAIQQVSGISRAVGVNKPGQFPVEVLKMLQQGQTGMGIDPNETLSLMTGVRQAGVKGGAGNLREVRRIWADGVASGLEKTRVPEHMQNVSKGMQMVGEQVAGVVDVAEISATLAELGQLGAGFQGARGGGVMNAMAQTFVQASRLKAPDAVQAFMLRHVGGYGGPGGNKNLFDAQLQLEKGFNRQNVRGAVSGAIRETGGGNPGAFLLQQAFPGLSLSKAKKLIEFGEGGFQNTEAFDKLIKEASPETKSVDEQMLTESKTIAKIAGNQWRTGKELYKETLAIKTAINTLVIQLVPEIKALLSLVRQFVENWAVGIEELVHMISRIPGVGGPEEGLDEKGLTPESRERIKEFRDLAASATAGSGIGRLQQMKIAQDQETAQLKKSGAIPALAEQSQMAADEMQKAIDKAWDRKKSDVNRETIRKEVAADLEAKQKAAAAEAEARMADASERSAAANETTAKNTKDEPDRKAAAASAATQAGAPPKAEVDLEPYLK